MKRLTDNEVREALATLAGWVGDVNAIAAEYTFPSYEAGVAFAVQVALMAQRVDHHPDLTITWQRVRVTYSTHDAGGVTHRDVEAARAVCGIAPVAPRPGH